MRAPRGGFAALAFCILCLGGILTLFSQARRSSDAARLRSLTPPAPGSDGLREALPAAMRGALPPRIERRSPAGEDDGDADDGGDDPPVRLRLR